MMRRMMFSAMVAMSLGSVSARADWAQELFQKSYDQVNNGERRGRYFVTGESVQSGTFEATLRMPESVVWKLTDDSDKITQTFSWSKGKGIIELPKKSPKSNDKFLDIWTSPAGNLALVGIMSTLHDWRDPNSLSSQLVKISSKFQDKFHLLTVTSSLPLVAEYVWNWKVRTEPTLQVAEWQLKQDQNEYLFVFSTIANGVKK